MNLSIKIADLSLGDIPVCADFLPITYFLLRSRNITNLRQASSARYMYFLNFSMSRDAAIASARRMLR